MEIKRRKLTTIELDGVFGGKIQQIGRCRIGPADERIAIAIAVAIETMKEIWGVPKDPWR